MPSTGDTLKLRVTATNLGADDINNVAFQIEFTGLQFVGVDDISAGSYDGVAHLWTLPNVFEYEPTDDNYEYLVLEFTVIADTTEPEITFAATEVSSLVPVAEYETVIDEALPVSQEELTELLAGVDVTRVSKLVSPNGIHDPVVQATNGGFVGVGGITTPEELIHAQRSGDGNNVNAKLTAYGASLGLGFRTERALGTLASPAAVANGTTLGAFIAQGYGSTGFNRGAQISVEADGTPSGDDVPGRIVFYTHKLGDAAGSVVGRLVIKNDGVVLIGDSPVPISDERFQVDGRSLIFQDTAAGANNSRWRLLNNRAGDGYNYLQVGTDASDTNAALRISRYSSTLPISQFRVGADLSHLEGNVRLGASNLSNIDIGENRPLGATGSGIYFQSDGDQRAAMSMVSDTWGYSTAFVAGGYMDNKSLTNTPLGAAGYFRSLGDYSPWNGRPVGVEWSVNGRWFRVAIANAVPTGADQSITFEEKFLVSWPEVVVNNVGDTDFRVRSTTNTHAFFVDAGNTYVGVGGSVLDHLFHVKTATASQGAHIGNAYIGNWSNNVYAQFGHWSYRGNSTAYALLQSSAADTYLNAGAGRTLHLRINNTSVAQITATGMTLVMPTHNIQFIDAVNTGGTTGNGYITCLVNGATRYIWLNPIP